jgi:hypothetical protein
MNQPAVVAEKTATFVLRLWRETTAARVPWRGRIEHVPSGEGVSFRDLGEMLRFLRRFGFELNDEGKPVRETP